METRAHHVLIGAFTVLVVAGAMLFALWLAKASISKQYDYYDIVFTQAVTGLSQGGMVQYNGIRVGDVVQLKLDPNNPSRVLVRIRVGADTPVKVDTRASLGLAGLTGVAFIQLTGGSPDAPLLDARSYKEIPLIQADESALSKLLAGSEDIMTKVGDIITRANQLLSSENVARISRTLKHLDQTTGSIAREREDLGKLISQLADASEKLNTALTRSNRLLASANQVIDGHGEQLMTNASQAMAALDHAATQLDSLISNNQAALERGVNGLGELGPAIHELRHTLQSIQALTRRIGSDPARFLLGGSRPREFTPQ